MIVIVKVPDHKVDEFTNKINYPVFTLSEEKWFDLKVMLKDFRNKAREANE